MKRDQLQPWNILFFDPQKTDVDEHIDLINTLGDMLGQTAEAKMEKFVGTTPTIIQTHLITCENWAKTTKKAKESEHIIRKCDPPAAALHTLTQDAAVPGLYSHIAHSNDKEETEIPQPFKGAKPKQTKNRGRGKGKQQQQKPNPPLQYRLKKNNTLIKIPIIIITIRITGVNLEAIDHIEVNLLDGFLEVKIPMAEANVIKIHIRDNTKATIIKVIMINIIIHVEAIIKVILMANLEAETMVVVEANTKDMAMVGLIIEVITTTNIISIVVMIMTISLSNMAHHVYYAVVTITPPKHCFKGEHDINNIMEKMNINGHQSQQSILYQ